MSPGGGAGVSSIGVNQFLSGYHPAISFRSVVAGVLVCLLSFGTLMSLGLAIGGIGLQNSGASAQGAGTFGGLWLLFSALVSLFACSYLTSRVSNFTSRRIGVAQGLVVAAAFFGIILFQAVGFMGWATSAVSSVVGGAAQAVGPSAGNVAQNNSGLINDLIEDQLGGVEIRGDIGTVASGVAGRLIRGDVESAKTYLSRHTNLTPAEIDARVTDLQARVNTALNDARTAAGRALQVSGWSIFGLFVLGMIFSALGGSLGARANMRVPMTSDAPMRSRNYRSAYAS
jgi:hypothetical protein